MKPLSIECPNLTCIINQSWPGCTVCLIYNELLLPYLDYNTIWLEKWNCIFAANWHSIPPANEYMLLQRVVFLKENFLAWICLRIFANLKHVKRLFQTRLDLSYCCLISFLEESPSKVARYKLLDWVYTFDMPKIDSCERFCCCDVSR